MPRLLSALRARRFRKRAPVPRTRIRSALFVDFDNVFHGLYSRRPEVADALARNFCDWLSGLAHQKLPPGAEEREILLWRAYVNPKGGVKDDSNDGKWLSLSRFREGLLLSGFEVVDCPALTSGMKNAADIRMVVDVLASLYSDAEQDRYDEFIIASDDADFTPLLQHLRAQDRRTMVISTGHASHAYTNLANSSLDFVNYLLRPAGGPTAPAEDEAAGQASQPGPVAQAADHFVERSRIAVPLSVLEAELKEAFGARDSWFGYDSLQDFLQETPLGSRLTIGGGYVWDPERHPQPKPIVVAAAAAPKPMMQLLRDTVLPKIDARQYWGVFAKAASYVGRETEYVEDRCVSWCRDSLTREGVQMLEADVRRILARSHVHAMARNVTPPTAQDICDSLISHTNRTIDGRPLRPAETRLLREWLEKGRAGARVPPPLASRPAPIAPSNPIRAVRPESASDTVVVKAKVREVARRVSTYKAFKVTDGGDFGRALGKAMLGPLGHGSWGRVTVHQSSGDQFLSYTFWIESDEMSDDGFAPGADARVELEALDLAGLGAGVEWICKQCDLVGS